MADTLAEGKNYRQEEIIGDLEDETLVEAVVNTITKDGGGDTWAMCKTRNWSIC